MKKILLPIVILIATASSLLAMALIRLSASMENWEVAWDEKEEDNGF